MNRTILVILMLLAASMASPSPKILIAYESTDFKKELVDEMAPQLKKDSLNVTIIDHSKGGLDSIDAALYDAVFITNSGVNSKVRPWVVAWLEKNKEHHNRILLHTTQTRKWEVNAPVDAVTSASAKKQVKTLAKEYARSLKRRVGLDGAP